MFGVNTGEHRFRARQENVSNSVDVNFGLVRPLALSGGVPAETHLFFPVGGRGEEVLSLLQHSKTNPKGLLDPLQLTGFQTGGGKGMSGMTAVAIDFGFAHLPEDSSAVGTIIGHLFSKTISRRHVANNSFGDLCFQGDIVGRTFGFGGRFGNQ